MNPESLAMIREEEERWKSVHQAVCREIQRTLDDYDRDEKLARELNAEIVAQIREEEKQALASDEMVARGLSVMRRELNTGLVSLRKQPYFARVVSQEGPVLKEFRLGTASFPSQRIVDWRKAPISKLYYDYNEGDDFYEEILGREREGVITVKRSFQGSEDQLLVIDAKQGYFYRSPDGEWKRDQTSDPLSRKGRYDGHLPPILSLITPDQFALITQSLDKPLLIQGVAGSGKTTVALHRLAWLLHEDNSSAKPEQCLVVMYHNSLKAYVSSTLPELDVHGVPMVTIHEWRQALIKKIYPDLECVDDQKSARLREVLGSYDVVTWLKDFRESTQACRTGIQGLGAFYSWLKHNRHNYLSEELTQQLKDSINQQVDPIDQQILLALVWLEDGAYPATSNFSGSIHHLVIDEIQDFHGLDVWCLRQMVIQDGTLTLVGDSAQQIMRGRQVLDWPTMLVSLGLDDVHPLELYISHRSTEEIMRLASHLTDTNVPIQTLRHGPEPGFIWVENETHVPFVVAKWIRVRQRENQKALSAILCPTLVRAQQLFEQLRQMGMASVRLGFGAGFDFSPGMVVTSVDEVKGLEFRCVLMVDADAKYFRVGDWIDRNRLFVAMTRALVRLDFMGHDRLTKLLPRVPGIPEAELRELMGS